MPQMLAGGGKCIFPNLVQQCDEKLLLGGQGVERLG